MRASDSGSRCPTPLVSAVGVTIRSPEPLDPQDMGSDVLAGQSRCKGDAQGAATCRLSGCMHSVWSQNGPKLWPWASGRAALVGVVLAAVVSFLRLFAVPRVPWLAWHRASWGMILLPLHSGLIDPSSEDAESCQVV
jgi:hypothetical protein